MQVIKRDGTKVSFSKKKIASAVNLANTRTQNRDKKLGKTVAVLVEDDFLCDLTTIVDIENSVEFYLKGLNKETYKEYNSYRQRRIDERFKGSDTANNIHGILIVNENERENGNLDENSFSGKTSKIAATLNREYARTHLVSPEVLEAFDNGAIHLHDFNSTALGNHNCTTIDLEDLLKGGFKTKNGGVREPKSIRAALDLTYLLIGTVSQNQFGGCAIAGFDTVMSPYLTMSFNKHYDTFCKLLGTNKKKFKNWTHPNVNFRAIDKKAYDLALKYTMDELDQAMEGFFHNLSTAHTREGNQLSFSSINYGNDVSPEALEISKCVLRTRAKGIGVNREIPIFPIGIFQYSECLHGEGRGYEWLFDLAVESTAKNIYPNYAYVPDTYVGGDWKAKPSTMGCRTMNGADRHSEYEDRTGRGNISPVTISLPYIALEAEGDYDKFLELLDDYLAITEKALLDRYTYQCSQKGKNAPFLYENGVLKSDKPIGMEDSVEPALKHGSLVFGYIGLAEALTHLFGKHHGLSQYSYNKGLDILKRIKTYAEQCGDDWDLNMSLYATPAESLCMKARDKAVKMFGEVHGVTDKEYFTNSHHIPVGYNITAVEKIELEAPFSKLATAGTILYNELTGDVIYNPKAVKTLVRKAMHKEVQYYAVNVPRDTCNKCGFKHYDLTKCPKCGSDEIKQLRRITGYTTSEVKHMNDGKQAEVRDRVKHLHQDSLEKLT